MLIGLPRARENRQRENHVVDTAVWKSQPIDSVASRNLFVTCLDQMAFTLIPQSYVIVVGFCTARSRA